MKKSSYLLFLVAFLQALLPLPLHAERGLMHGVSVLSTSIKIDRVYKSMEGPYFMQRIPLVAEPDRKEVLWIKKVALEFVDAKDKTPLPISHLCHSHIMVDDTRVPALFTLIQGQNAIELPGDFAVPTFSHVPLLYYAQILNLKEAAEPFDIRVKTTVMYLRDSELAKPVKPVLQNNLVLKIPISEETAELIAQNPGQSCHGPVPSVDGSIEVVPSAPDTLRRDAEGQPWSYHWNVPPGKHTYTYDLEPQEIQTKKGTIHFGTVHLHPYGRAMELIDLTTNTTVLRIEAETDPQTGDIKQVKHFYSEGGVPYYGDHKYRITAEYDNTTAHNIDAMAFMYIYVYDKEFDEALILERARLSQEHF